MINLEIFRLARFHIGRHSIKRDIGLGKGLLIKDIQLPWDFIVGKILVDLILVSLLGSQLHVVGMGDVFFIVAQGSAPLTRNKIDPKKSPS